MEQEQPSSPSAPAREDAVNAAANPSGRRGRGFLAVAGTVLLPGLGHAIARRPRRGLAWLTAQLGYIAITLFCAGLPTLVPALVLLVPGSFVLMFWTWFDAYRTGRRSTGPMLGRPWRRYVAGIALVVLAAFASPLLLLDRLARTHWVHAFVNPSGSMSPTLIPGDRFLVNLQLPVRRWDVVAFHPPNHPDSIFVMRIAALPGEIVEIIDEELHVNGQRTPRPHGLGPVVPVPGTPAPANAAKGRPLTLRDDEYFVLGDNSRLAGDSRYWFDPGTGRQPGALPADHILGPAIALYWPPSRWRRLKD